eukprot:CAMPEP_0113493754 /NCGR_PEP_ID=MMETSP0014_2-20120614/28756_1 /TAXON_ID=2857 /ORGANISM="Nitzschia sp." /LENGTH=862 /DNA_ID=CAMNT_0000387629 /DNA_START=186 /DNA_END=2774 /DNA_ORIENTATION=+ /assembly_acc=CAM_ASM_000159
MRKAIYDAIDNERQSKKARPTVHTQGRPSFVLTGLLHHNCASQSSTVQPAAIHAAGVGTGSSSSTFPTSSNNVIFADHISPRPFPVAAQLFPERITVLNEIGIKFFDGQEWKNASVAFTDAIRIIERGEPFFVLDRVHRYASCSSSLYRQSFIETLKQHQHQQYHQPRSSSTYSVSSSSTSGGKMDAIPSTTATNFSFDGFQQIIQQHQQTPTTKNIDEKTSFTTTDSHQSQPCQQNTEYDEGMDCFERPESFDILTKNDMLTSLYYNLGLVRLKEGNDSAALAAFLQAQFKSSSSSSSSGIIKAYKLFRLMHKIGYVHYRTNNHVESIVHYHRALTLAMNASLDATMIAATLNCIAVIHFHRNAQDSARTMELLKQSLKIYRERTGTAPTKEVATVLNNMGRVLFLQCKYQQALKVYKEALAIRELVLRDSSIDIAATTYNSAKVHQQLGEKEDALKKYHQFLSLMKVHVEQGAGDRNSNSNSNIHAERDIATGCRCIADVYQERSEPKRAIPYLREALQSTKKVFGLFHSEVASILNKLGNLYYEIRDYATALIHYRDGLTVETSILSPDHPHIIVTLTNIGHILKQQHDYPGAALVYKKVLKKQRKTLGDSSLDVAATLSSLGLAQYHDGLYEDAFECYQDALRIRREHFESDDHLDIASTLNSIGLVLFKQHSLPLAEACFSASLKIRIKLLGKDHREVAVLWYNSATVQLELGHEEVAIRLYRETLRVERAALGEDHADVVLTLQHLGQVHHQLGKLDEALHSFKQALEVERRRAAAATDEKNSASDSKGAVARLLNLIGNIYIQLGDIDMMMESFVEAARILERRGAEQQRLEPLLIHGYNHYGLSKLHPPCAPVA